MAIWAGDVLVKKAIQQGIQDMQNNIWLLNDVFSSLTTVSDLREEYGDSEIQNAKDWFMNNAIEVALKYRKDSDKFPLISIALGSSEEALEERSLADLSPEVDVIMPLDINKPIGYILQPFVPGAYDPTTKTLSIPDTVDISGVTPGMVLINPANGIGYVIEHVTNGALTLNVVGNFSGTQFGVIPQYRFYKVRRERAFFNEVYTIGCHVHGDPAALLWLDAITSYILLRYREALLEARGFNLSYFGRSDFSPNPNFAMPETVYSRYITLRGKVENSWLKTPYRIIESIQLKQYNGMTGVIILSNLDSPSFLQHQQTWVTQQDTGI